MTLLRYGYDGLPTIAALRATFTYNHHTGLLAWKTARGPRIKPGDEAGTVLRDGTVVVNLEGKRYQAARIAWALYYGAWPTEPLRFWGVDSPGVDKETKIKRRQDLAIDKLSLLSTAMAERELNERRDYDRAKRQYLRNADHKYAALPSRWAHVPAEGLVWSDSRKKWQVYSVPRPGHDDLPRVLFQSYNQVAVENFNQRYRENLAFLDAHPMPVIEDPHVRRRRAGRTGHELGLLHKNFAYDPDNGRILWREHPEKRGLDAVHRNPGNRFFVTFDRHPYAAHRLAWFLHHGYWPARRAVVCANGDAADIRLANLHEKVPDPQSGSSA